MSLFFFFNFVSWTNQIPPFTSSALSVQLRSRAQCGGPQGTGIASPRHAVRCRRERGLEGRGGPPRAGGAGGHCRQSRPCCPHTHIPRGHSQPPPLTKENCAPARAPRHPRALSRGHHSLVLFALTTYMLISHGPSPPCGWVCGVTFLTRPGRDGPANAQPVGCPCVPPPPAATGAPAVPAPPPGLALPQRPPGRARDRPGKGAGSRAGGFLPGLTVVAETSRAQPGPLTSEHHDGFFKHERPRNCSFGLGVWPHCDSSLPVSVLGPLGQNDDAEAPGVSSHWPPRLTARDRGFPDTCERSPFPALGTAWGTSAPQALPAPRLLHAGLMEGCHPGLAVCLGRWRPSARVGSGGQYASGAGGAGGAPLGGCFGCGPLVGRVGHTRLQGVLGAACEVGVGRSLAPARLLCVARPGRGLRPLVPGSRQPGPRGRAAAALAGRGEAGVPPAHGEVSALPPPCSRETQEGRAL